MSAHTRPHSTSQLQKRQPEIFLEPKDLKKHLKAAGAQGEWWRKNNQETGKKDDKKWDYLEHHGVTFPSFYEPNQIKLIYKGKGIVLNGGLEEICYYWAAALNQNWKENPNYEKNFKVMFFKKYDGDTQIPVEDFHLLDFSNFTNFILERRLKNKNRGKEVKKQEKERKIKNDNFYGKAVIDNSLEKVGGYCIEIPTLFKGRGKHPKAGKLKARILPETITLNLANDAPVPKCGMPGHNWNNIVHNNTVTWLAFYRDDTINTQYKYIYLDASSKFKGQSDIKKYNKARKLKKYIKGVRRDYSKKINSSKLMNRQLGTAVWIIDKLALRVGNEKGEGEADTYGCCSLQVGHIFFLDDDQIKLDFLGKDSMRYENTVTVPPEVYRNMKSFCKGKSKSEDLFDKISTSYMNEYLKSMMNGLTAKVFRTYNASTTLQKELNIKNVLDLEQDEKVKFYDHANKQVAILCNHQKTVPKSFASTLEKMQVKITELNEQIQLHKTVLRHFKSDKPLPSDLSQIKRLPKTAESCKKALERLRKRRDKQKFQIVTKEENKNVALNTSKLNYNDPRITIAWAKRNDIQIERLFPKSVREKFPWAMSEDPLWEF